jgi:hypothetical protein
MELAPIAAVTGPGKVFRLCFAAMLASHCVFEMKRFERRKGVRSLAIFAAAARAISGQAPQRITHCASAKSPTCLSAFKRSAEIMSLTSRPILGWSTLYRAVGMIKTIERGSDG